MTSGPQSTSCRPSTPFPVPRAAPGVVRLACASLLAATLSMPVHAEAPTSPFDGTWTLRMDCPSNSEASGAKGYRFVFPATVTHGVLTATNGVEGQPGSLRIEGPIADDGDALLLARGRTGDPAYAVRQPSSGTPYTFRIQAHFGPTSGTGKRLETRVCDFSFSR